MGVRPMRASDRQAFLAMRLLLWPDDDGEDDIGESVLVWEQDGSLGGFVIYSLRPWAEGCLERPVPYIEGWFVREDLRRRGIGRALVTAAEDKARADGFHELGSDVAVPNPVSLAAHRCLGFERTERLQFFRKNLVRNEERTALTIEQFHGLPSDLLPLFGQADDSPAEISRYLERGEILVARQAQKVIGHVQLIPADADWEISSIAVIGKHQGQGIGTALIHAALDRAFAAGATRVLAATATADIDTLRFYQRLGFRMNHVERDAFSPERGYATVEVDGIPVRDRVWFSIEAKDRR